MSRPLLLLAALLSLAFAPAPFLDKKKNLTDLDRMQGTWVGPGTELRVEGHNYTYYRNGAKSIGYTVTLNETTNPRQYDLRGPGGLATPLQYVGIYELKGDTLRIASNNAGSPRPAGFSGTYVRVLTRKRR